MNFRMCNNPMRSAFCILVFMASPKRFTFSFTHTAFGDEQQRPKKVIVNMAKQYFTWCGPRLLKCFQMLEVISTHYFPHP
jgi:hypothetical protein